MRPSMVTKKQYQSVISQSFCLKTIQYVAHLLIQHFDTGKVVRPIRARQWMLRVVRRNQSSGTGLFAFNERAMRLLDLHLSKKGLAFRPLRPVKSIEKCSGIIDKVEIRFREPLFGFRAPFTVADKVARLLHQSCHR